jgi:5-methylthioadenosine/S-adenosylhomocysteine deaminase
MTDADLLISGGLILLLDEKDTLIEDGALVISGDAIADVGTRGAMEQRWRAPEVLDARGCLIMPGLVNAHTHAAMTCFRGIADDLELMDWLNNYIFPAEAKNVDPELAYWGTLLACAEMIRSGTTAFSDMYIFENETAEACRDAGMRGLLGEVLFDFPSPNFKTPDEGLAYTERLIRKWSDHPLIRIMVEPHALYTCSQDLLLRAKGLANRYGIRYAVHLLENLQEMRQLQAKYEKKAVTFLKDIGFLTDRFFAFHCVCFDDEDIRMLADGGCGAVYVPESNMKLASGAAPVSKMIGAGIPVGLGTDGCASNNNLDMFGEMDSAAKLEKVERMDPTLMPARTVLRMATCQGAKVLGMEAQVGRLQKGMKADVIVLNLNKPHLTPLYNAYSQIVYSASGADVETVIINGRIVMKNRRILTFDEQEAMRRVSAIADRVKRSLSA